MKLKVKLKSNVMNIPQEDWGMDTDEFNKLVDHIDSIGDAYVTVDNGMMHESYFTVKFLDGYEVEAIAFKHLKVLFN